MLLLLLLLLLPFCCYVQDRSLIKSKTLQQLGDWDQPLSAQHEVMLTAQRPE
jgi:hypothetical protein